MGLKSSPDFELTLNFHFFGLLAGRFPALAVAVPCIPENYKFFL